MSSGWFRKLAVVLGVALVWSLTPTQAVAATPSLGVSNSIGSAWAQVKAAGGAVIDAAAAGVFQAEPAAAPKVAAPKAETKPPGRVREVVGERTATSKVFELSNGKYQAEITADPVHYRDGSSEWRKIDTTVSQSSRDGYVYGSTGNRFGTFFGSRSDQLVRFELGKRHVTIGLPGQRRELTPMVDGSTVIYKDAFGTADLRYRVTPEGLKEEIVLEEAPETNEFSFTVRMGGVEARELADGSIGFFRPGRELTPVFSIPAPFMFDAADEPGWSDAVSQSVSQRGSETVVTLTADEAWLNAADRDYPVTVDPTVVVEPTPTQGQDAMIRSTSPDTNYGQSWQLGVGTDADGWSRSLLKFDVSWLPEGATVDSAAVKVWYDQAYYTNANDVALEMRSIAEPWDETTVTWTSFWGSGGSRVSTETKSSYVNSVWHTYGATDLVNQWVAGTTANHGVMIMPTNYNQRGLGGAYYEAAEYAYNGGPHANRPKLVVTYGDPGAALKPITTAHSTGPELAWEPYAGSGEVVEYQVHRSVWQTFNPSAATLVSPVPKEATSFTDTTAEPTAADDPDPFGNAYYWMVAAKLADGTIVPGNTQLARLPKAGYVSKVIRGDAVDTTLSKGYPNTNQDVFDGEPWLAAGDNGLSFGTTRTLVKFPNVADEIPAGATVHDVDLKLWKPITFGPRGTQFNVHNVTRDWDEKTATWNQAETGVAWSNPGGDYSSTVVDYVPSMTADPKFHEWYIEDLVQDWVDSPSSNHGALIKAADESSPGQLVVFDSNELASEPQLRPQLHVTYTQPTAESTYYAPKTPKSVETGEQRTVPVTITNTTGSTIGSGDHVLSYHWKAADGTDVTDASNRLDTPLPSSVAPGESVTLQAKVKAPALTEPTNKREEFTLSWDVKNTASGQWMSQSRNIPALDQSASVANPTSNQIGLEKFYQYSGQNTGAGSTVMNNLFAGNTVWSYNAFSNPSRGVSTFARMTYNSLDTSQSAIGYGWSLAASSVTRLGTPLDFHPRGWNYPRQITLTDGDGTAHLFTLNKNGSENTADWTYDSPHGVHLYLQKLDGSDPTRAWVLTSPDRTKFYFDADGYQSALADRNDNYNELLFTYANRKSQNKPIKFLKYLTDPVGRQTLTIDYYEKGDAYVYVDDTGAVQQGSNLTNPKIIDQIRWIKDVDGRQVKFVYTEEGLLGQMEDGVGDPVSKKFNFAYDATQGNKNVKLVKVTDPRGNATDLTYYEAPTDPKAKWFTETVTSRVGGVTRFDYVDPDGSGGDMVETTVTDAENNATFYRMDGFGRPVLSRNAKGEETALGWDGDHNVIQLTEDNGAVSTWEYDQNTGYPTLIKDAEANANGTVGTVLEYDTSLDGHVADLTAKTSPEGRRWEFGYDGVGNVTSVTDPAGVASTGVPDDYTTTYTYNYKGLLKTATDANGNTTSYPSYFNEIGYPKRIADALGNLTYFTYDARGNVLTVTDADSKTSSYTYDLFSRPLESQVPKDQANDVYIVTPAPDYDANDNVTKSTAPNGAVTSYTYDKADRMVESTLPKDKTDDPARVASYEYDLVGNLLAEVEPKGNLTPDNTSDFTTTYGYDAVYQMTSVTNAAGHKLTYSYDNVGNVTKVVDPRKNATTDPDDYTTTTEYDLNHRATSTTDAAGHTASTTYDLDGLVVESTDKQGSTTLVAYGERGLVEQVQAPHDESGDGTVEYRTTKYVYDEAGNRIKVITPRGVETSTADDFVAETVYDPLNRAKEQIHPYDPTNPDFATPDKTVYGYDKVGNMTSVSAPPSDGQSARNVTTYDHFDNGWIKTSTDSWDITTTYDYNDLGQQKLRTITSAGGASQRSMSWSYTPDGKLAGRGDDGVPVGEHVALVDNTDAGNTTVSGTWGTGAAGTGSGFFGHNYRTHAAGSGTDSFMWDLKIPDGGTYEVFARYPTGHANLASDASYKVKHKDGTASKTVDQTAGGGQWVSLGSYSFGKHGDHQVTLGTSATGVVAADAVMAVRDNTGEADNEAKDITYTYDPNGNMTGIADASSGAKVDAYEIAYTGLNQVKKVDELNDAQVVNTTSFTYNVNGAPLTTSHDDTYAEYTYDLRDLVDQVTNGKSASDPEPKVTSYTYTPNAWTKTEEKANGNTVTFDYYLDGLLKRQLETKADGTTVVAEHDVSWDANGNKTKDVSTKRDADGGELLDRTHTYTYDPRDRTTGVTKTDTSSGSTLSSETYTHDAASNVIEQTIDGTTTSFVYDRNRLLTATTSGSTAAYNYDAFGRLDTITSAGDVIESNTYDGFDRIKEHTALNGDGTTETTAYSFDAMDRTLSRTDGAGTESAETTDFSYLGLSSEVLNEEVAGDIQKSYQYSPWGKRLSQVTHNADGTEEDAFYGYNPRTDVETLTDESGDTVSTYGYTAFGKNDEEEFTGVDAPDAGTPGEEPYNVYRYNAKRWDTASGTYDMGFRNYNPGINRFLTRDMYSSALADLNLTTSPWTSNRYAFTGGNPTTLIEIDGHKFCETMYCDGNDAHDGYVDMTGESHDPTPRCYGIDCRVSADETGTSDLPSFCSAYQFMEACGEDQSKTGPNDARVPPTIVAPPTGKGIPYSSALSNAWKWTGRLLGTLGFIFMLCGDSTQAAGCQDSEDDDDDPRYVYRAGSASKKNLTPRPGKDPTGLSTYDDPSVFPAGTKLQIIDVSLLTQLTATADPPPPHHVSIHPLDVSEIDAWAATRDTDVVHPYTQDIMDAVVGTMRAP